MKNALLVLLMTLPALAAEAVVVSITVQKLPTCTHADGRLRANASGGVGPYTYLWSTGATTQIISGLLPGSYSVTVFDFNGEQASNTFDLPAGDYGIVNNFTGDLFNWGQALCNTWTTIGFDPTQLDLPGPAPYSIGGDQLDTMWITNDLEPWVPAYPVLATSIFNPTYGFNEFSFSDADGCPGLYQVFIGWPVEWPEHTIDNIEGACEGTNSGSITISYTAEGHYQPLQGFIEPAPNGVAPYFSVGEAPITQTISGLPAGSYSLNLFVTTSSFLPSSGCAEQIGFTIPDLGPTCGVISGTAYVDNDQNCARNGGEAAVQGAIVEVLPGPIYLLTDVNGYYEKVLPLGSYTVEQQSPTFDEHCIGTPLAFTLSTDTPMEIRNFPDTSLVGMDAMVAISSGAARPGFQFDLAMQVRNLTPTGTGATTVSVTVDPTLIYLNATPAPSNVNGNILTWNQASLGAWQHRNYTIRTQVPPDIGLLGTQLATTATLTTVGTDGDLSNNTATNLRTITGAYDPNDKLATTSSGYTSQWLVNEDEWVDYTIRFQNTGTDTAFNVLITDTLPTNLDPGTIVWGAASHAHTRTLEGHGVLKFHFPNILLPDSNINEPLSHGFVGFRIRPRLPLLPGDEITNTANIYFDFNPPVITEPSVLVAELSTGVAQRSGSALTLSPVPASDLLNMASALAIDHVAILSADGRLVTQMSVRSTSASIDVKDLPSGTYIVIAELANGTIARERFIKR